jgi:hypothetical protein
MIFARNIFGLFLVDCFPMIRTEGIMLKLKNGLPRYIIGIALGALIGLVISRISAAAGSQCFLLCQPRIAMAYFSVVGLVISLK